MTLMSLDVGLTQIKMLAWGFIHTYRAVRCALLLQRCAVHWLIQLFSLSEAQRSTAFVWKKTLNVAYRKHI